jgi:hypothetical protein
MTKKGSCLPKQMEINNDFQSKLRKEINQRWLILCEGVLSEQLKPSESNFLMSLELSGRGNMYQFTVYNKSFGSEERVELWMLKYVFSDVLFSNWDPKRANDLIESLDRAIALFNKYKNL